jgi:hypothetical protein
MWCLKQNAELLCEGRDFTFGDRLERHLLTSACSVFLSDGGKSTFSEFDFFSFFFSVDIRALFKLGSHQPVFTSRVSPSVPSPHPLPVISPAAGPLLFCYSLFFNHPPSSAFISGRQGTRTPHRACCYTDACVAAFLLLFCGFASLLIASSRTTFVIPFCCCCLLV